MKLDRTIPQRSVHLHEEKLRPFLLASMGSEHPLAIALALQYEVVSLLASAAETEEEARLVLAQVLEQAWKQIEEFGVGHPHP
jgi:hypothetical protein